MKNKIDSPKFIKKVKLLAANHNISTRQAVQILKAQRSTIRICCKKHNIVWKKRYRKSRIGEKIGNIQILNFSNRRKNGSIVWKCLCKCGKKCFLTSDQLYKAKTANCGCLLIKRSKDSIVKTSFDSYRKSALRRKKEFQIDFAQFERVVQKNCYYCNASPAKPVKKLPSGNPRIAEIKINGIDRMNNKRGYHIRNIVPCCTRCNYAKGAYSLDEFKSWVKQVYHFSVLPPLHIH